MKILVIDSETSACDLLVRTLKSYFPEHEWLTAASYEEGYFTAQKTKDLDLVFADLKTNEAGGPSLTNLIESMYPNVCTYYLGNHGAETTFPRVRPGRVFSKPVNVREIVAAIQLAEQSRTPSKGDGVTNVLPEAGGAQDLEKLTRLIADEGFTGQLAQFQLHEIIQLCCLGQRTGRMSISKGSESGVIFFYDGQIVHSVCGDLEGEPAVERIVAWKSGQFTIADGIIAERRTIETDWNFLILESMRKLDEQAAEGPAPTAEVKVGGSVGPYQLAKEVSKSATEEVYIAHLHSTGLELTVCVLPPALNSNLAEVKRFVAEATTKSDLDDTAFLRVTKAVQTEGVYYYTVERVEATRLDELAPVDRHLTESQALDVLRTVGTAMAELRSVHRTHLPLTPRDVLLDSRGGVRLSNLASFRPEETVTVRAQLQTLTRAVRDAVSPATIRAGALKSILRRMEGTGPDRIQSWQGLKKAADSITSDALAVIGENSGGPESNTSYAVNLVPDHATFDILKLGIAAAIAGLLVGSIFWVTARPDHANARGGSGSLMAAEPSEQVEHFHTTTNVADTGLRVYDSVAEMVQSPANKVILAEIPIGELGGENTRPQTDPVNR
jgi:DNA-binding NarL/FixJ family response regulator